jgi:hypothetical protein
MAAELGGRLGLSEQELRDALTDELDRALRAQGGEWAPDTIAHGVARVLHLDHLRMLEQFEAAGIRMQGDSAQSDEQA